MAEWLDLLQDRPFRYSARTGSTNDDAAEWLAQDAPDGALVLTDEQLAGRGRYRRLWQAAPGSSLLMSVILRVPPVARFPLPAEALPRVTLLGAVALAETLAGLGLTPGIKWPNDVLLGGRKVAGILAEAAWQGAQLQGVVLGIGLNVRQDALPPERAAAFHATTLEAELGSPPDRGALLADLLARLDDWRMRLESPELLDAWRGHSVTLGRRVDVTSGEERLSGVAAEIDAAGALLLRLDSGEVRRLLAGDVTLHE